MNLLRILFKVTIVVVAVLSLTSCDCQVSHQGFVLDDVTGQPIPGAFVYFNKRKFFTDSLGFFDIHYIAGKCDDCNYTVEKSNYRAIQLHVEYNRNEVLYRISEKEGNASMHNSMNFKVQNDTITFYLKGD